MSATLPTSRRWSPPAGSISAASTSSSTTPASRPSHDRARANSGRAVRADDARELARDVVLLPRGRSPPTRRWQGWLDRQPRIDRRHGRRRRLSIGVSSLEGGGDQSHAQPCGELGRPRHPRQRHRARLVSERDDRLRSSVSRTFIAGSAKPRRRDASATRPSSRGRCSCSRRTPAVSSPDTRSSSMAGCRRPAPAGACRKASAICSRRMCRTASARASTPWSRSGLHRRFCDRGRLLGCLAPLDFRRV